MTERFGASVVPAGAVAPPPALIRPDSAHQPPGSQNKWFAGMPGAGGLPITSAPALHLSESRTHTHHSRTTLTCGPTEGGSQRKGAHRCAQPRRAGGSSARTQEGCGQCRCPPGSCGPQWVPRDRPGDPAAPSGLHPGPAHDSEAPGTVLGAQAPGFEPGLHHPLTCDFLVEPHL